MKIIKQSNDYEAETWKGVSNQAAARISASITCANGHTAYLGDHEIKADGTVDPSVLCPEPGCDWHERVILDGWDGGQA